MKSLYFVLLIALFTSCATPAKKMNQLSYGMSKNDVLNILGKPLSTSRFNKDREILHYSLRELFFVVGYIENPYYVVLEHGKVVEYGNRFEGYGYPGYEDDYYVIDEEDVNKAELTSVEILKRDLKALQELYEEGLINKEEYDRKKGELLNQ